MFLSSLTLCNTISLFTRSVQLIFSILLQHHISKLSTYFWSTVRSVQVSAPYKAMLQIQHFISFSLKSESNVLVKRIFLFLNAAFELRRINRILLPSKSAYESNITFLACHNPASSIGTRVHTRKLSTEGALCTQFFDYNIGCHFTPVTDNRKSIQFMASTT